MPWFETRLQRDGEEARVRISHRTVEVHLPRRQPMRGTYQRLEDQAACVFEAHVEALRAAGYQEVDNQGDTPSSIPSLTATLDHIAAFFPTLTSLRFPEGAIYPDSLHALVAHPIIGRLQTLDIIATGYRPDLDLLFAHREALGHLRDLFITDHVLSVKDRVRVDSWSTLCRVGYTMDAPRYQQWLASLAL